MDREWRTTSTPGSSMLFAEGNPAIGGMSDSSLTGMPGTLGILDFPDSIRMSPSSMRRSWQCFSG